jgi:predicted aspartyl protease
MVSVQNVPTPVFPDNRLQVGLLGMSFLSKLSHFEVARPPISLPLRSLLREPGC